MSFSFLLYKKDATHKTVWRDRATLYNAWDTYDALPTSPDDIRGTMERHEASTKKNTAYT